MNSDPKKINPDTSVNLALLYATLVLVAAEVLTNWPPEGQKESLPEWSGDLVFGISALLVLIISCRVAWLILTSDPFWADLKGRLLRR